jgi:hypothetical protein
MPTIVIPTALRTYTENQTSLRVEASTVGEAIQQLVERVPEAEAAPVQRGGTPAQLHQPLSGR